MEWKYKIWILFGAAIFAVTIMYDINPYLAFFHIILFAILFSLTIYRQFYKKE